MAELMETVEDTMKKKIRIPEGFTKCNLPFGPIYPKKWTPKGTKMDSFDERGLNLPGTLIITEDGEQFLIGHINRSAGCCDDCKAFEPETKVIAYKKVWEGKQ